MVLFGLSVCWLSALASFPWTGQAAAVGPRAPVPPGFNAPSYYPTPHGGWTPSWADSYAKAKALVESMTLAEKTNITAGVGIYMGESAPPATAIQNTS